MSLGLDDGLNLLHRQVGHLRDLLVCQPSQHHHPTDCALQVMVNIFHRVRARPLNTRLVRGCRKNSLRPDSHAYVCLDALHVWGETPGTMDIHGHQRDIKVLGHEQLLSSHVASHLNQSLQRLEAADARAQGPEKSWVQNLGVLNNLEHDADDYNDELQDTHPVAEKDRRGKIKHSGEILHSQQDIDHPLDHRTLLCVLIRQDVQIVGHVEENNEHDDHLKNVGVNNVSHLLPCASHAGGAQGRLGLCSNDASCASYTPFRDVLLVVSRKVL
mmetsp:Transcript_7728/g.18277  ORF Transcript_7728/g.18277 Transcript_7728/m.18277 type:complete len:272 (-) Transcript_7728:363-1178(-)